MLFRKRSMLTGIVREVELDVTPEQFHRWNDLGEHIQNVMPHLTADQREFLISGVTKEEWDENFKEED